MTKLLTLVVGPTVGGVIGGGIAALFDLGFGWDIVLSGIGSMIGVYVGWKLARRFGL